MRGLTIAGQGITIAGTTPRVPDLSDVADLAHCFSFVDSHVVGGRVVRVDDRAGGLPLREMPGTFPLLGGTGAELPGPLYIESSARFNGRPAAFFDSQPRPGSVFPTFAGLTPNTDRAIATGVENTQNYFAAPNGYAQPYWVAVLGRLGLADGGGPDTDPAAVFDATHGGIGTGPTIGRKILGGVALGWQVSNFGPSPLTITVPHDAVNTETVLLICRVNGASSFLEVNWRDAGGTLRTLRQNGTLLGWNYLEAFAGWVHGQYLADVAIGLGAGSEPIFDAVRAWGSYWIPPAGALPAEP